MNLKLYIHYIRLIYRYIFDMFTRKVLRIKCM